MMIFVGCDTKGDRGYEVREMEIGGDGDRRGS
jgi:hypothetical protein